MRVLLLLPLAALALAFREPTADAPAPARDVQEGAADARLARIRQARNLEPVARDADAAPFIGNFYPLDYSLWASFHSRYWATATHSTYSATRPATTTSTPASMTSAAPTTPSASTSAAPTTPSASTTAATPTAPTASASATPAPSCTERSKLADWLWRLARRPGLPTCGRNAPAKGPKGEGKRDLATLNLGEIAKRGLDDLQDKGKRTAALAPTASA